MKFLLDESADARLGPYLHDHGHDVTRLGSDHPAGLPDEQVLSLANAEGRILITNDRDFGERVVRLQELHTGVILFRLAPDAPLATKIERLEHVLTNFTDRLDQFLVVRSHDVRTRRSLTEPS